MEWKYILREPHWGPGINMGGMGRDKLVTKPFWLRPLEPQEAYVRIHTPYASVCQMTHLHPSPPTQDIEYLFVWLCLIQIYLWWCSPPQSQPFISISPYQPSHQMHQIFTCGPTSGPWPGTTCRSAKAVCHRAAFSHAWQWLARAGWKNQTIWWYTGQVILLWKKPSIIASFIISPSAWASCPTTVGRSRTIILTNLNPKKSFRLVFLYYWYGFLMFLAKCRRRIKSKARGAALFTAAGLSSAF